ncbi:hypothetical protein SCB29_35680, partial [Paraburkholderia sp. SIMBA_055]
MISAESMDNKITGHLFIVNLAYPHAQSNPVTFSYSVAQCNLTACMSEIVSATGACCVLQNQFSQSRRQRHYECWK